MIVNGLIGIPLTVGEEYGWREYLLPCLLALGEIRGTLVLGLIWGLWHLPIIALGLNYPGQPLWAALAVFLANVILMAFVFTWFYVGSGGSILVVAVLHSVLNAVSDTFTTPAHIPEGNPLIVGGGGAVSAALVLLIVAVVYGMFRRATVPDTSLSGS